nr:hypothetical protein [Candidatus Sigynarchaeota archaeon]
MENEHRIAKKKDSAFFRYEIKSLVEKIIKIIIIQSFIYGIFILIDPGFLNSLIVYFSLILFLSIIITFF